MDELNNSWDYFTKMSVKQGQSGTSAVGQSILGEAPRRITQGSAHYVFLDRVGELGRRDAVFLPIGNGAVHGVAVFASRYPNNFRVEHLALLRNLGGLLGVSLVRTLPLTKSSRLASTGQFASGTVHEIRNPLGLWVCVQMVDTTRY